MKIFRVETESGRGPFHGLGVVGDSEDCGIYHDAIDKFFEHNGLHRTPDRCMVSGGKIFGSRNVDALREWFSDEMLDILRKHGYCVAEYNVKTVYKHSDPEVTNQVSFKRKNAILIQRHPLFSNHSE